MSRRWPLHPPPYPHEALSSWVNRIAQALAIPPALLLQQQVGLPHQPANRHHLDFDPPEQVLLCLAQGTGQAFGAVRRLTARGYVPSLIDTLDETLHAIAQYTHALAFLLPKDIRPVRHPYVLPWYSFRRFRQPRGCRDCLAASPEPYLRLHWRFPWMLTCPTHKRMLEPLLIRIPVAGSTQVWVHEEVITDIAPSSLLMLDTITLQAITSAICDLPCGKVPGALWMRLLRTVLDELGVGATNAGAHYQPIKDLWGSVGLAHSHYLREWRPYEVLIQKYQEMFMLMAANAFTDAFEQPTMRHRIMELAQLPAFNGQSAYCPRSVSHS